MLIQREKGRQFLVFDTHYQTLQTRTYTGVTSLLLRRLAESAGVVFHRPILAAYGVAS